MNDFQPPYYNFQGFDYGSFDERAFEEDVYRPDDAEDAPVTPPPTQMLSSLPATFSSAAPPGQMKIWMCQCLGKWGFLGLKILGPFGRDFWFYPTEVRQNGVSGYIWQGGRRRKVSYRYSQIRNFMCFA